MGSAGTTVSTDELIVATLDEQGRTVFDQFFEKVPTFEWLRQNNKIRWDGSGYSFHCPIRIGKNTSSGKTSGYKTLITTPVSTINEVAYVMRRYYATVTYNQDLVDINRGNKQIINLVADKIDEAKESIIDNISTDLFAASTATDAFDPIPVLVDSTGAAGGVNQSSVSAWASYEASLGSFAAGGIEGMQTAYNTVSKGKRSGRPSLIVTDQTTFQYYQNALRAYGMGSVFVEKGDLGVEELKFQGCRVIWDADCTSGNMFFLNNNGIGLVIDGQANMKATEFVKPADQLAKTGQIYCRLATVLTERRSQAKLTGITA